MTRVSDLYIELIPPNPLELQVTVAGAYESLTWSHDGMELAGSGSVSFSDFRQTLTVNSTSAGDVGEYTAAVSGSESVTFQVQEFRESRGGILSYISVCVFFSRCSPVLRIYIFYVHSRTTGGLEQRGKFGGCSDLPH